MRTISFDECSVLKLCVVKIPASHKIVFGREILTPKNHNKVKKLIERMKEKSLIPHRFVPSNNTSQHALMVANQLIEQTGVQPIFLNEVFRKEVRNQLGTFIHSLSNWKEISKGEASPVKKVFFSQEKELKKKNNIPEDDDCAIIAGLQKISGEKIIVSEDEHFWGYEDLIQETFDIKVVKEWECDKITI